MLLSTVLFVICSVLTSEVRSNELTKGISNFASEFYYECAQTKPGENVVVSSLSVSSVLALLLQGANGNTLEELKRGLHLESDKTTAANQFQEYYGLLEKSTGGSNLSIASKIYVQEGHNVKKEFHDLAVKHFSSGVELLNFAKSVESAQAINQFVEEKTNNHITDLIQPDMISSDTRMVLVNAIYFKGNWQYQFDRRRTTKGDFYTSETEKVPVDMMRIKKRFNYAILDDLNATALEMKYAKSNFTFVIVLPDSRTGLPELETKLKNYDLSKITDQMRLQEVDVTIPKFKVEFKIKLNDVLKKLGMAEMFSSKADLSGLLESNEPLSVSDVVHKAFIEMNEEGSEAAAATAGTVALLSFQPSTDFQADHPFVYFIRETAYNTNIFSGRFVNSSK